MDNCEFLLEPTDSYWCRDFGPWFIFNGNDELGVINFPYNRPRPNDDDIPIEFAAEYGFQLYGMNIEHTGGNYMCDGMGKAASTDLVLAENADLTEEEISSLVNQYLGIEEYLLFDDPLGEYIEHIDCWGKFLDVDKILIGEVSESDPRYDDYEAIADYFENASSYEKPYEVYRVFTPGDYPYTPYTNSLIVNDRVFVPITGSEWDNEAIASYEEAMPGYEIIGVEYSDWLNTDALHCRTRGIADPEMLYIEHTPLSGTLESRDSYEISARIIDHSESGFISDSLRIYYKYNTGDDYTFSHLTSINDTLFTGEIPYNFETDSLYYYLHAADNSGRSENHPYIGQSDPHSFQILNIQTPENLTISYQDTSFVLSWDPVSDAVSYNIYMKNSQGSDWELIQNSENNSIQIPVTENRFQLFRVTAVK